MTNMVTPLKGACQNEQKTKVCLVYVTIHSIQGSWSSIERNKLTGFSNEMEYVAGQR